MRKLSIGFLILSLSLSGCIAAGISDGSGGGGSGSLPELEVGQVAGTRATIAWTEPADSDVASYEVRVAAASADIAVAPAIAWEEMAEADADCEPAGALNTVSCVVNGLNPNSEYDVAVRYTTTDGEESDEYSAVVDTSLQTVVYDAGTEAMELLGWRLGVGDVNNDGYADTLSGGAFSAGDPTAAPIISLALGGATPGDATEVLFVADEATRFGTGVVIGDVNCDGIDDVLIGDGDFDEPDTTIQGQISIYFGKADWAASYTQTTDADVVIRNASDRNERDDQFGGTLAVGSDGAGCSYLFVGAYNYTSGVDQHGAAYVIPGPITADQRATVGQRVYVGDVADGRAGLYLNTLGHLTDDAVDWLAFVSEYSNVAGTNSEVTIDNGTDALPPQTVLIEMQAAGGPIIMENVGDIDGNGWDDFAIATPGEIGGLVIVYLNTGDFTEVGTRVDIQDTQRAYFGGGMAGADINNDGEHDLIISGQDALYVYLGPYSGTDWFDEPDLTLETTVSMFNVALADVNGDDYLDFFFGDPFYGDNFAGSNGVVH